MFRYCRFFEKLRKSSSVPIKFLANIVARDIRSVTGMNVKLVMDQSGSNVWSDSPGKVKAGLLESDIVTIPKEDSWRVTYLGSLLQHRQEWHYRGDKEQVAQVQALIDSLCVN